MRKNEHSIRNIGIDRKIMLLWFKRINHQEKIKMYSLYNMVSLMITRKVCS